MSARIVTGVWSESDNLPSRPDWQRHGACTGQTDLFYFTAKGRSANHKMAEAERLAKQICAGCTVQNECLRYAIDGEERFGVWGGLNTDERDLVARARRTA